MNWFKLYAEFATDPKVQSMSEPMQRRLVMLYCLHCGGELAKLEDEEIALAMRISPSDLKKTQELFRRKGFIGEGWNLPKWEKRQGPMDPGAAERMRRSRANKAETSNGVARNVTRNVTRNVRVTMPNGCENVAPNVTPPSAPPCSPPLDSPSYSPSYSPQGGEFRVRERSESPPPPLFPIPDDPIPDDPVSLECIHVATERWGACNGDSVIGDFLRRHKPAYVRHAIDREWDKHGARLQPAYLRSILQGIEEAGGLPKKPGEDRGKTAVQQRSDETLGKIPRPDLPRTPQFAGVNRYYDDMEAGRTPNPKDLAI